MIDYSAQDRYDDDFREWRKRNQSYRSQEAESLEEALSKLEDDPFTSEEKLREERWILERRLHDLIRWERDDLEWEWKLKRQEERKETRVGGYNNRYRRYTNPPATGARKNRQHKKRSHPTQQEDVQN